MKGTVRWFNNRLGYGFIAPPDGGQEYFVHHSAIEGQSGYRSLSAGDLVRFTPVESDRGPQARQVQRVGLADDGLLPLAPGEGVAAVQKIAAQWIDWQSSWESS